MYTKATEHHRSPLWSFNGDHDRPTFSPSLLVRWVWGDPPKQHVCHSFVENGRIRFLDDCTHKLKGQTVDLIEIPQEAAMKEDDRQLEELLAKINDAQRADRLEFLKLKGYQIEDLDSFLANRKAEGNLASFEADFDAWLKAGKPQDIDKFELDLAQQRPEPTEQRSEPVKSAATTPQHPNLCVCGAIKQTWGDGRWKCSNCGARGHA